MAITKYGARIAKVQCSLELLSALISGELGTRPGTWIETDAPSDLQVISIEPGEHMTIFAYCESATFEPVEEGAEPPVIEPFTYRLNAAGTLSEAYAKRYTDSYSFARCRRCGDIFIDDIFLYGSLICPNPDCNSALERGIKNIWTRGGYAYGDKETERLNRD